jgi:tRNA A-37 threonylcarbamoyl transferase component Bud32
MTDEPQVHDDDINDAIQDAVVDGEGRLTAALLKRHLLKRDLSIVNRFTGLDDAVDRVLGMTEAQVEALALQYRTAEEAVAQAHKTELTVKQAIIDHDQMRLNEARRVIQAMVDAPDPRSPKRYLAYHACKRWLAYYEGN